MGEGTDADEPFRFEQFRQSAEKGVAGREHGIAFFGDEVFRREVFPAGIVRRKEQRAKIGDKVFFEKAFRGDEALFEKSPESSSADFRALAGKAFDRLCRVFPIGVADKTENA